MPAAVAGELKIAGRAALLDADDDPRPRHRRRHATGPRGRPPLRLGDADPHRPRQAPARVPLDPARPPGRDPRPRDGQDQRRVPARRPGADAEDGQGPDRARRQPRRLRRLRPLQGADRRGRRDRRRRASADPLEPLRLPLRDRCPLPGVGRLAVREGRPAHERAAGAHLLEDPREPARPVRDRPRPGAPPAAGDPGHGRQGHLLRHGPEAAVQGRQHRQAARDRPQRGPGARSSAGRTSARTRATRSTVASAASPAAPTASRSSSAPRTTSPRSRCSPGRSAPLAPPKGLPYAPGCVVGDRRL